MLKTIVLILLFLSLATQLWARYSENQQLHVATKPLLVPLIMMYYCLAVPVPSYNWLVLAGLLLGWLGDVLRIPDSTRKFGFYPFVAGHFVYMAAYLRDAASFAATPVWGWLLFAPALAYVVFYNKKLLPAKMPPARRRYATFYVFAVTSMVVVSTLRFGSVPAVSFWVVLLGAVLFWLSDQILIWGTGADSGKNRLEHVHVYVMLSYTLGQFCIALGYVLLAGAV